MIEKIASSSQRLLKYNANIKSMLSKGYDIESITNKYDLPPVATLRTILDERIDSMYPGYRYKDKNAIVRLILQEDKEACFKHISSRELELIQQAKQLDQTSYSNDPAERESSMKWETSLYNYLHMRNVSYIKEDVFVEAGSASTPDCLLLDDVYINGKLIRWIDSKNFYGTTKSRIFLKNLMRQTAKYENFFNGPGAIIYRLGFSASLEQQLPNSLLLDEGDLVALE
jgi:hypothetical protein